MRFIQVNNENEYLKGDISKLNDTKSLVLVPNCRALYPLSASLEHTEVTKTRTENRSNITVGGKVRNNPTD